MTIESMIEATIGKEGGYVKARGAVGVRVFLAALNAMQGARYIELARTRPANEAFLYGWLANRVAA